jgi:hypothetical protein
MGLKIYPEYISIRLPATEKEQLRHLIAAASGMGVGRKMTIKEYITDLIVRSAASNVVVPIERTVPMVRNDDIAQRIALNVSTHTFDCISMVRGSGKPELVNGKVVVPRATYGDSDVVRELLNIEWEELKSMLD